MHLYIVQCVECRCLHSYLHKTCNSQLLLIILHARQLLHDLGHTLYESICSYVYREFSEQTLNEYESSIMVTHHYLKRRKLIVLVHTHIS